MGKDCNKHISRTQKLINAVNFKTCWVLGDKLIEMLEAGIPSKP